ncbi:MAG: PAS domain-containing sensor histidine kinase [Pseudomonadota bacterium]
MTTHERASSWDRLNEFRHTRRAQTFGTFGLVLLGPALAIITYLGLGPAELDPSSSGIRLIILADFVYILVIATLVLRKVVQMIAARRAKSAGSRLHLRLTGVFAIVALVPTVLVAVFAVVTVNFGLEGWFSDRVSNVVGNSLAAAQAYEQEQTDDLTEDTIRLAGYMNVARQASFFMSDSDMRQLLSQAQAQVQRGLKEAYIIDGEGNLKARGERSYLFDFEQPSSSVMSGVSSADATVIKDWDNNEFRAIIALPAFADRYLYVSRSVDGEILRLLDDTQETVRLYQQLENDRGRLLFEFGLLYLGFAAILILAAIWLGLWFAERLSGPVGRLATAAQDVGRGNLDVQVIESKSDDEIEMLGSLFNQMTRQLKRQRDTLLVNTEQIERRRRLFDSVLSSVSAGVIGLDSQGQVTFLNRAAHRLLDLGETDHTGQHLSVLVPEFAEFFDQMADAGKASSQHEIKLTRAGKMESLLVRISPRTAQDGAGEGFVVAFDDVTQLVSAQKMAAWGDVARRIAHEIKNPLTPIQLSAERLRRKFAPVAGDDLESLEQYTDVIVRQIGDLRRIVDEFSKFARMPEPERRPTDIGELLRDSVTLQRAGQPEVSIVFDPPEAPVPTEIDATMIGQALTNLIKNAGEAIESRQELGDELAPQIRVDLLVGETELVIRIADNGVGLPEDRARLFEPYVTTRAKGTGLGLPIVKKIIEEHGGTFVLQDAPAFEPDYHRGAEAVITLPRLLATQTASKGAA